MTMKFGKWRGFEIEDLPSAYLRWLARIDLNEPFLSEVKEELERRQSVRKELAALEATR
jgi:uncharacterized protein (DUF3820 family)